MRDDCIEDNTQESLDEDLLAKASDCIEFISKKRRITESVTNHFVTNVVELNKEALTRLKNN